jgi:hypothetical protein
MEYIETSQWDLDRVTNQLMFSGMKKGCEYMTFDASGDPVSYIDKDGKEYLSLSYIEKNKDENHDIFGSRGVPFSNKWKADRKVVKDLKAQGLSGKDARDAIVRGKGDKATVDAARAKAQGTLDRYKQKGKDNRAKVGQGIKTVGLAPVRGAYSALILVNFWGKATQLNDIRKKAEAGDPNAKKLWDKVTTLWLKLGGNRTTFKKEIEQGAKAKPKIIKIKKKSFDGQDEMFIGQEYLNVAGIDDAALIASATSIITAIAAIVGKSKEESQDPANAPAPDPNPPTDPAIDEALNEALNNPINANASVGLPSWVWVGIIGGTLAILGTAGYFILRKK